MIAFFMKSMAAAVLTVMLFSCAVKAPVQEMSEARSAIERAQQLDIKSPKENRILKRAEQSLEEAASAIDGKHYELARRKAVEAKRQAQRAAKIKHGSISK